MPPSSNPASLVVVDGGSEGANAESSASASAIFCSPAWAELARAIDAQRQWTEQRHLELTAISAPTFHESARAEWMAEQFRALALKNVRMDEAGNVLADRPGVARQRVWVTAHLDTVFPAGTNVQVRRDGSRLRAPGISDNGAGLAALLTIASVLQQSSTRTNLGLRFVANVGEEGEGDLRGMRHLFASAEARRTASAVIVLDGPGTEHLTTAGLGSRRFLIEVTGPGGHSWNDFGRANPIHALAAIIGRIEQIPLAADARPASALGLAGAPRSTISVGLIEGGTTVNSIPRSAWMKVDIRSTAMEQIERLTVALHKAVADSVARETERGSGSLEVRTVQLGERPAATAAQGSRLAATFAQTDQLMGIRSQQRCSSTDANWPLSLGIDAVSVGGGGAGGGAHTLEEWFDAQGRELGIKRVLLALLASAGVADNK